MESLINSELAVLEGYERIDDVEITMHAELDHKTIPFGTLLNLQAGGVLEFGRPTGENVDVYAEDILLGTGEILIVESTLAIRIADLRSYASDAAKAKAKAI